VANKMMKMLSSIKEELKDTKPVMFCEMSWFFTDLGSHLCHNAAQSLRWPPSHLCNILLYGLRPAQLVWASTGKKHVCF
jgi:hypothetical protein